MARHARGLAARSATLALLLCGASPAFGQDAPPPAGAAPTGDAPAPDESAGVEGARSYTPADFARFAPRNALDMLNNVPGFAIDAGNTNRRGLGQATRNVLINGERFSGKSTDIATELRRISASSVVRIDIVDGATLNVAGLAGPTANVITAPRGVSGSFAWRPQIRARRTPARLLNGEVAISGAIGGTQYSLSARNNSFRSGNAGPELVFTPGAALLDRRDEVLSLYGEDMRVAGTLRRTFRNGAILNVNAGLGYDPTDLRETSLRSGPGQPDRVRNLVEITRKTEYELGGDYEFALGGGQLKLIGLHRLEHRPFRQILVQRFADSRPDEGSRYRQVTDLTETIGRGEYRWNAGPADWQFSVEGAVNRQDVDNSLFTLNAAGDFAPVPFLNAQTLVEEQRAEATLTHGRSLSTSLTLQVSLGAEYSQLSQTGAGGLTRSFYRPKGFASLAWRPRSDLAISARVERVVGQLNFFDFAASADPNSGTTNAGNVNLVPPQSWDAQVQATRTLGPWGTITGRLYGRLISDVVDIIPIGATGQAPGNLPGTATVYGVQWTSTFNFDPIGWRGAQLDLNMQFQHSALDDPLTGLRRPINEDMTRKLQANFRYDIPNSDWACGLDAYQFRQSAGFRLDQRSLFVKTPGDLDLFVEHKNVAGLTVRATVANLLGNNERFVRTFYDGRRTNPALFTESRDRFYGPVFTLSISGTI